MQLHQLRVHKRKYPHRRVGRGGKRGTTAGHGTKGQRSRAGRRIRPGWRDMLQRTPKLRGVGQRPAFPKLPVVNIHNLARLPVGIRIDKKTFGGEVKILGNGELSHAVIVQGLSVSASAKKKIVAAGGTPI